MALPIIRSKGIQAYCSDVIVDSEGVVYLLSVAGYQVAVKGIIANVLEYGPAILYGAGGLRLELTRDATAYKVRYHRLPSGLYQAVLLPKMAYAQCQEPADRFMVLCQSGEQSLFFDLLQARTDIPLHPSWADWLWRHMEAQGEIIRLETVIGEYQGFLVTIDQDRLRDAISDEIRNRNPALLRCFEKEGNDGRIEGLS